MAQRRIRIGIDTGGTFTDVVAFDEDSGELVTTKTPSTPSNPADGFINGIDKVLGLMGAAGDDITAVCHGTTVATNKLLEGKVERLGFITTEGYEFMLEIARQAVPDGYGNSYFWVKPPRIVAADHVRTVGGRMDFEGNEVRPFDEDSAVAAARWFKERGITTIGVCFLHSYADDDHELRDARDPAPRAPRGHRVDLQRGAARVPRVRALDDDAGRRRGQAERQPLRQQHPQPPRRLHRRLGTRDPLLRHEVQRRRALRRRGRAPADHDGPVRPGGRRPRCRAHRPEGRLRQGPHLRRRRHLDRRVRRPRRRADPDHRGHGGRLPEQDPDDRRRHRRRRRRLHRLGLPRGCAQGRAAVGRRRPRPALLRQGRHRARRSPTPT